MILGVNWDGKDFIVMKVCLINIMFVIVCDLIVIYFCYWWKMIYFVFKKKILSNLLFKSKKYVRDDNIFIVESGRDWKLGNIYIYKFKIMKLIILE